MTDEEKAILFLKKALRFGPKDLVLTRALEYETLKGGRTMFFRDGKGKVYETMPDWNTLNSYDEDYLDQELVLDKYREKTMFREEVHEMLECEDFHKLFMDNDNNPKVVETVRATLIALGYDRDWIGDIFEPELYEAYKRHG